MEKYKTKHPLTSEAESRPDKHTVVVGNTYILGTYLLINLQPAAYNLIYILNAYIFLKRLSSERIHEKVYPKNHGSMNFSYLLKFFLLFRIKLFGDEVRLPVEIRDNVKIIPHFGFRGNFELFNLLLGRVFVRFFFHRVFRGRRIWRWRRFF